MAEILHHAHASIDIAGRGAVAIEVTSSNYSLAHDVAAAIDDQEDLIRGGLTYRQAPLLAVDRLQGEVSALRAQLAQEREIHDSDRAEVLVARRECERLKGQLGSLEVRCNGLSNAAEEAVRSASDVSLERDRLHAALRRIAGVSSCQSDYDRAESCQGIARAALAWADGPIDPRAVGALVVELSVARQRATQWTAPYAPATNPAPTWTIAQVIEHLRQITDPDKVSAFGSCLELDPHAKPPLNGTAWTKQVRELLARIDAGAVIEALPPAVAAELQRARERFPSWPTDPLHALAVLGEEFGELTKAVLQEVYEPHKQRREAVRTEAVQTAAMALRFLASVAVYEYRPAAQHQVAGQ